MRRLEEPIHCAVVAQLRLARVAFIHSHNPGRIGPRQQARMKALGATSPKGHPLLGGTGLPDLLILTPPPVGGYVGAALEIKAPGGRVSPAQTAWLSYLVTFGWATRVGVGKDECLAVLREWGYVS